MLHRMQIANGPEDNRGFHNLQITCLMNGHADRYIECPADNMGFTRLVNNMCVAHCIIMHVKCALHDPE